jgi:hypothetical protein
MTHSTIDGLNPSQCIAIALFKVVDGGFGNGLQHEDLKWLEDNPEHAAKLYRYYSALTWFWADWTIQRENISDPPPNEFMPIFRDLVFTKILGLFPGIKEDGIKTIWSSMFDDDENITRSIFNSMAQKADYINVNTARLWFSNEGIDIFGPQGAMWLRAVTASAVIRDRVDSALVDAV